MSLEVLHATESLLPAVGGAERLALEWLAALAPGHRVRAVWLEAPAAGPDAPASLPAGVEGAAAPAPVAAGYWEGKRRRREAIAGAVAAALEERPADVVVTALHAAPAAVEAARAAGAASVLVLPSYESLCKYAFDAGSRCRPASGCRECPRARELDSDEFEQLLASRAAHERSLAAADRLVAPSPFVARACEAWCGRSPVVVPAATVAPPSRGGDRDGPIVLAAARWTDNKGAALLLPLARALAPRAVAVTERGLEPGVRSALVALGNVELLPGAPASELLAGAAALLVPSQWPEPFGRIALEGMAAGVPTLASAVGGLVDFVPAGSLVAPPGSLEAWVAAVAALDDPARREAVRSAGLAAAEGFLVEPPAATLERLLEEAVLDSGRARAQRRA
jgi:glycosyltransferase involved in cell wall biosynthesis